MVFAWCQEVDLRRATEFSFSRQPSPEMEGEGAVEFSLASEIEELGDGHPARADSGGGGDEDLESGNHLGQIPCRIHNLDPDVSPIRVGFLDRPSNSIPCNP